MKGKKQKLYADKIAYSCFGEYTEGHGTCETQCPHKMHCEILQETAQQRDVLFTALTRIINYGAKGFKGDFTQAQIAKDAVEEVTK